MPSFVVKVGSVSTTALAPPPRDHGRQPRTIEGWPSGLVSRSDAHSRLVAKHFTHLGRIAFLHHTNARDTSSLRAVCATAKRVRKPATIHTNARHQLPISHTVACAQADFETDIRHLDLLGAPWIHSCPRTVLTVCSPCHSPPSRSHRTLHMHNFLGTRRMPSRNCKRVASTMEAI